MSSSSDADESSSDDHSGSSSSGSSEDSSPPVAAPPQASKKKSSLLYPQRIVLYDTIRKRIPNDLAERLADRSEHLLETLRKIPTELAGRLDLPEDESEHNNRHCSALERSERGSNNSPRKQTRFRENALGTTKREESYSSFASNTSSTTGGKQPLTTTILPRTMMTRQSSQSSIFSEFSSRPSLVRQESTPPGCIRRFRLLCGHIVEHPMVQMAVIFLIIINALFMGLATFDFVTDVPRTQKIFSAMDVSFLSVFTVEIGLQLLYRGIYLFVDSWLTFDFCIVVASWSLESIRIIRAFRIFRAVRLVSRIGPLRELVMALGDVMPRIYAIGMLLVLVFYVFAVLFTQLFGDLELDADYFTSLPKSLFTCMQLMTLEWADITRQVMVYDSWAWAPLMSFISITGFIVFNLIVAVVCDAVSVVDKKFKAEQQAAERERLGLTDDVSEEQVVAEHLKIAMRRVLDLTKQVNEMKDQQALLLESLSTFAKEWEQRKMIMQEEEE